MSDLIANFNQASFFSDEDVEPAPVEPVPSPFTIVVDSSEQRPYKFESITGDYRDDYAPIRVRTIRKRLKTGDYAILEYPGIAIERKSKEDLFSSVRNDEKRENFIERLKRMERDFRHGVVLVECTAEDIYENPPLNTSLSPKSVYRTAIAWSQEFPSVHWYFCQDREWAEQTCYRILERFYLHETLEKHRSHNKIIKNALDDFIEGMNTRRAVDKAEIPFAIGSPRRDQWLLGWYHWSAHFFGGDFGRLYEVGEMPDGPVNPEQAEKRARKSKRKKTEDDPIAEMREHFEQALTRPSAAGESKAAG